VLYLQQEFRKWGAGRGDLVIGTSGHRVKPTTEGQIHKDEYMETSPRIGKARSASRGYSTAFYAKFTSPDLVAFPFPAAKRTHVNSVGYIMQDTQQRLCI
jgi:hypothetical protein